MEHFVGRAGELAALDAEMQTVRDGQPRVVLIEGPQWAVMGHAQGGHAALFAASLAPAQAPHLDLIAAVAIAPAAGALAMIAGLRGRPAVVAGAPEPGAGTSVAAAAGSGTPAWAGTPGAGLAYLALVLTGAAAAAPGLHLDRLLAPPAAGLLESMRTAGIDDLCGAGPLPSLRAGDVFRPDAELGPLLEVLAASDPAALRLHAPVLIVQGSDDPIVPRTGTDSLTQALTARGAELDYHVYPGRGHFDVIAASHIQTARWIDALAQAP